MASLFDTINQNRQQIAGQAVPQANQTNTVATLLRAKSGQVANSGEGPISSLGEQSANDTTSSQMGQVATNAKLANIADQTANQGQQQQFNQAKSDIAQANKFATVQNNIKTNQLLGDLSRDKGTLDQQQQAAKLEQTAFLLSMQDKQYTDQLEQIGRQRRLDNDVNFKQEMQQVAFKDELDILKSKLSNGDVLSANDRDFSKAMADLSIDDAIKLADLESKYATESSDIETKATTTAAQQAAKAANQTSMYQGLGSLVSSGVGAYGTFANGKPAPLKTSTAAAGTDTSGLSNAERTA